MSRESQQSLIAALGSEVRAHQRTIDALDEAVSVLLGVNRTDLRCLDVLLELGSATPGLLASTLGLTTGSVTAMLDRLEKRGYASRSPDPTDRRRLVVRPSSEVAEMTGSIYRPLAEEGERGMARYTDAELELLIGFLRSSRALQEKHLARIQAMPPLEGLGDQAK